MASRLATRVGPLRVVNLRLINGKNVTSINDTQDETLFMSIENMPFLDALEWSAEYVQHRYSSEKSEA